MSRPTIKDLIQRVTSFDIHRRPISQKSGIDYSLKKGDIVYSLNWGGGKDPLEIIDINWALKAAAVRLSMNGRPGNIVVLPVANLVRH